MTATISGTGRVLTDPVLRKAGSNDVLNFRYAMENGYGDKKKSEFFQCTLWGARAVSMQNYITKGTYLTVLGAEFSTREYETNGEKRVSLELKLEKFDLGPRTTGSDDRRADAPASQTTGQSQNGAAVNQANDFDDEIPF